MIMDALPKTLSAEEEEIAKNGLRELLASLPQSDLESMLGTVTNYLVRFGSVPRDDNGKPKTDAITHAINSILFYGDTMSLLNKRKMKKSYLAEYLNQKGVRMTMPATKNTLCKDALHYWGVLMPSDIRLIEDEAPRKARAIANGGGVKNEEETRSSLNITPQNHLMVASDGKQMTSTSPSSSTPPATAQSSEVSRMEYESALSLRRKEAELGQQLGREFTAWFYERLNTLTDFTVAHFWAECNFRLEIIFAAQPENTLINEIMMNGEAACANLKDLVGVKMLYFEPNLTDAGSRGYLNPHGLAQVMVCGVIHHRGGSGPVGVFEQMFGLMKDPRFGSNFKIKFSVLRLREGGFLAIQNSPPELCDSSLVGIVEEIDDDEEDD